METRILKNQLQTKEFKKFLMERLSSEITHPLISQPRMLIPLDTEFEDDHLSYVNNSMKIHVGNELVKGKIQKKYKKFDFGTNTPCFYSRNYNQVEYKLKLAKSPEFYHDGIIAGGAIASLANEFLFGVPAIINDVDYFYYSHFEFSDVRSLCNHIEYKIADTNEKFKITKSDISGLCNFIKIKLSSNKNIWESVLDSFDLNCCMIGFHPQTQEIIISSQFEEFIESRQIKHHKEIREFNLGNIIRAKTKSEELKAKYYYKDNVRSLFLHDLHLSSATSVQSLMSYVAQEKSIPVIKRDKNSFNYVSPKEILSLEHNPMLLAPILEFNKESKSLDYKGDFNFISFYQQMTKDGGTWKKQRNNKTSNWFINRNLLELIDLDYPKKELPMKYYNRLRTLINTFKDLGFVIAGDERKDQIEHYITFLKQEIIPEKFSALVKTYKEHPQVIGSIFRLLNHGWHYSQIELLLKRLLNKDISYIGIYEQLLSSRTGNNFKEYSIFEKTFIVDISQSNAHLVMSKLDEIYWFIKENKKHKNQLRQKSDLGILSKYVTEMITIDDLELEGQRMRHCVAGRVALVSYLNGRIFHLIIDSKHSTLEVLRNSRWEPWVLGEHKTYLNGEPSPKLEKLSKILICYLNAWKR